MMGRRITLTYDLIGRDTDDEVDPASLITVPTELPGSNSDVSAFTIKTIVPTNAGGTGGNPGMLTQH